MNQNNFTPARLAQNNNPRLSSINPYSLSKANDNNPSSAVVDFAGVENHQNQDQNNNNIIYYDGNVSILDFIGYWNLLKACVDEGAQIMRQLLPRIDVNEFFNRINHKIRNYNYTALFIRISNFLKTLPIMGDSYSANIPSMLDVNEILTSPPPQGILQREPSFDHWNNFDENGSDTCCFDDDMTSISAGNDSGISNPNRINHLENEIEELKNQLLALSKLVKNAGIRDSSKPAEPSKIATVSSGAPVPPPPPPPGFFNAAISSKINIIKPSVATQEDLPRSVTPPPSMHDILKELNSVKLRSVPRSPGGTPCRAAPVPSSDNFLKSALQNKFKNAKRPDDSFENNLDDDSSLETSGNWD